MKNRNREENEGDEWVMAGGGGWFTCSLFAAAAFCCNLTYFAFFSCHVTWERAEGIEQEIQDDNETDGSGSCFKKRKNNAP